VAATTYRVDLETPNNGLKVGERGEGPPETHWYYALGLHQKKLFIGPWVKRVRQAMEITQADLAEMFDVQLTSAQKWESGGNQPSLMVCWVLEVMAWRL
jgi:DNA-binding transcriptional regulator YiaG